MGSAFALWTLACALQAARAPAPPAASAAATVSPTATFGEGELANAAVFEFSVRANELLADADAALATLRKGAVPEADRERTWNGVFDAWCDALGACGPDEWVAPDPAAFVKERPARDDAESTRRADGVEAAVSRRLDELADTERAAWRARVAPRAERELARAANEPARWEFVERAFPATEASGRAALALADLAFEEGRGEVASVWLARAERHARRSGPAAPAETTGERADFAGALVRRRGWLAQAFPPAVRAEPAFDRALGLGRVEVGRFHASGDRRASPRTTTLAVRAPGESQFYWETLPGAAELESGRIVVQTSDQLIVFARAAAASEFETDVAALLTGLGVRRDAGLRFEQPPLRSATPIAVGEDVVLALGFDERSRRAALMRVALPNVALALEPRARVVWALADRTHVDGDGRATPLPAELSLAALDFQPGPAVFSSEIVWLARETSSDGPSEPPPGRGRRAPSTNDAAKPTFAVAVDLATGSVRWKRKLAVGPVGPKVIEERFGAGASRDLAPLELGARDGAVIAVPHTGSIALCSLADGRLGYSFKTRRRLASVAGWQGRTPLDGGPDGWIVAPCDSDRGYRLAGSADFVVRGGRGALRDAPFEIGDLGTLLHADGERVLAVVADGERERLAWIDLAHGGRVLSLALPRGEHFSNRAAVSARRVLAATDRGLALFDRERELELVDRLELGAPVIQVLPTRDGVVALGHDTLWRVALR